MNTMISMFKMIDHWFKMIDHWWLIYLTTFTMCLEICGVDFAQFLSALGLVCQAASKKTK